MSALRWSVALTVVVLAGCPVGLGERCATEDECQPGLVCRLVDADGPGLCDYPLRGEGEPCTVVAECSAELTCSNHFTPNQRYGQCVTPHATGESCWMDRDCVSGVCEGADEATLGTCQ